jgi:hypothetical protein
MAKRSSSGVVGVALIVSAAGCGAVEGGDVEQRAAALGGSGGEQCTAVGNPTEDEHSPWYQGLQGFIDSGGNRVAVARGFQDANIVVLSGTPINHAEYLGANVAPYMTPAGYRRHDGLSAYMYLDPDGHLHEHVGSQDTDFATTFGINAPIGDVPTCFDCASQDITGYVRSDNQSAVVYVSRDHHAIEVRSNFSGWPPWVATDLTIAAHARVNVGLASNVVPYVRSDGWNSLVYVGNDSHVHELATLGNGWGDWDLSAATGDVTIPIMSNIWGYQRSDGWNSVLYVGYHGQGDLRVHELAYYPGGSWGTWILPSVSALGGSDNRATGYVRADGVNAVVYNSWTPAGYQAHELELVGGAWVDVALPSPCALMITRESAVATPGNRSSILFQSIDWYGIIHMGELSQPVGGAWSLQLL